jgi:hypothetical protein
MSNPANVLFGHHSGTHFLRHADPGWSFNVRALSPRISVSKVRTGFADRSQGSRANQCELVRGFGIGFLVFCELSASSARSRKEDSGGPIAKGESTAGVMTERRLLNCSPLGQ